MSTRLEPRDSLTVLVVDDDPAIGRMLQRALRATCNVEVYYDPTQALEAIERGSRYDVILCDWRMPGLAGRDFEREVRVRCPSLAERIIFMSGADSKSPGANELERFPGDRRLRKPFSLAALRDAISGLVRSSGRWLAAPRS